MRFRYMLAFGVLSSAMACFADPTCVAKPSDHVAVGQSIVIEIVGVELQEDDAVSWTVRPALGHFETGRDRNKATYVPESGADVVTIVCHIISGTGARIEPLVKITIDSSGKTGNGGSTPSGSPAMPPGQASHPSAAPVQPTAVLKAVPAHGISLRQLGFVPAGYMGEAQDGRSIEVDPASTDDACSGYVCIRMTYTPPDTVAEPKNRGWAAVAWQFTSGPINFGDDPGANLQTYQFQSLHFNARGLQTSSGKQPMVQFKSGGGTKPGLEQSKKASYEVVEEFQAIPAGWRDVCIGVPGPFPNATMQNVVSGLTVVFSRPSNPTGATIYLSDLRFSAQSCEKHEKVP